MVSKIKKQSINLLILSLVVFATVISGCATTGYMSKTGPALVIVAKESEGATAVDKDTKVGESCSHNILGLVSAGDNSIDTAKRNGRITQVSSYDTDFLNVLGIYGRACTIVRGN